MNSFNSKHCSITKQLFLLEQKQKKEYLSQHVIVYTKSIIAWLPWTLMSYFITATTITTTTALSSFYSCQVKPLHIEEMGGTRVSGWIHKPSAIHILLLACAHVSNALYYRRILVKNQAKYMSLFKLGRVYTNIPPPSPYAEYMTKPTSHGIPQLCSYTHRFYATWIFLAAFQQNMIATLVLLLIKRDVTLSHECNHNTPSSLAQLPQRQRILTTPNILSKINHIISFIFWKKRKEEKKRKRIIKNFDQSILWKHNTFFNFNTRSHSFMHFV